MQTKLDSRNMIQLFVLAVQKLHADNGYLRASGLTFYTILSIVPLLAFCFGIATGFGLDKYLKETIYNYFSTQQETFQWLITIAENLLAETKGEIIAGLGILILLISVFKLLGHIETDLNTIWKTTKKRRLDKRLSIYITVLLLGPLIFILSSSLALFISKHPLLIDLGAYASWIGKGLAMLCMAIFLSWLYYFLPHKQVKLSAAFLGGFISAALFFTLQWLTIKLQINLISYGAVYGSFAAFPIFLVWMQLGWIILLYGAEIAYIQQTRVSETWEFTEKPLSKRAEYILIIRILQLFIDRLLTPHPPYTMADITNKLALSDTVVEPLINQLIQTALLVEIKNGTTSRSFQPAMDLESLTLKVIIEKLNAQGISKFSKQTEDALSPINEYWACFESALDEWPMNVSLKLLPKNAKFAIEDYQKSKKTSSNTPP